MTQFRATRLMAVVLSLFLLFGAVSPALAAEINTETEAAIRQLIDEKYYLDLGSDYVKSAPLEELLGKLDEFSGYMTVEQFAVFDEYVEQKFGGIGIQVNTQEGRVVVTGVLPGTPAARVGLKIGDKIATVGTLDVRHMVQSELVPLLRGPVGESVLIGVERGAENRLVLYSISREIIDVSGKVAEVDENGIGYFKVNSFAQDVGGWFLGNLIKLQQEGMKGLIIDLRGNPGGRLESALGMSSALVEKDEVLIRLFSRDEEINYYKSLTRGFDGPVVVLTDGNSASASEFVTVAVKDNGLGIQVGETTFGKGVIQTAFLLPNGDRLKLTTAEYRGPAGTVIDKVGLTPDVEIADPQEQVNYAYGYLRNLVKYLGFEKLVLYPGTGRSVVNDREITMPGPTRVAAGRTMVPLRFAAESMKLTVVWEADGTIRVYNNETSVVMKTGSVRARVNDTDATLDAPVRRYGSLSYVPLRFLAESFGASVSFDGKAGSVTIQAAR